MCIPTSPIEKVQVPKHDEWISKVDLKAFGKECRELGNKLRKQQGQADVDHLNKILYINWFFTIAGIASMFLSPNVFTIICLSTGLFSRWTMIGHHVCHGGYDNTSASKNGFNRWVFGVGTLMRRFIDWFDWMLPEAWNIEHGRLHHYSLNEEADPDLVEKNSRTIRDSGLPLPLRYVISAFFALTWKWTYYSTNTYSQLLYSRKVRELVAIEENNKDESSGKKATQELARIKEEHLQKRVVNLFTLTDSESTPSWWSTVGYLMNVALPFVIFRFFVLPMPFFFLFGKAAFHNAIINLVAADMLTNLHSFIVVAPNHAGDDLYWFDDHCEPKSDEFFLRQVIGSVDFAAGNDTVDFFHGFLNYQIEHHMWPDLSMLSYQKSHPIVKDICKRHGIPYIQENVFWRTWKLLQIFVGTETMRKFNPKLLKERS